jgi:glycosyltransferase 2 family protein
VPVAAVEQFKRYFRPLILSVALAILIYLIFALFLDWQKSYEALRSLSGKAWLIILGLSLMNYGIRAVRWYGYMIHLGNRVPFLQNLFIYFAGFAFTTTPGKLGETIRSLYLKRYGVSYQHSLAAFFAERLVDVIAMILLSLCSLYAFSHYRVQVGVFVVAIIGVLLAIRSRRLQGWIADKCGDLSSKTLKNLAFQFISLVQAASSLLKNGPLSIGLVLGLVGWGAEGYAMHIILADLGYDVGRLVGVGVYSVAIIAGAVSFIPGGLGSTEAVMGGSLLLLGVDPGTAVAATLICRLVTLWFAIGLGLLFVLALEGTGSALGRISSDPASSAQMAPPRVPASTRGPER